MTKVLMLLGKKQIIYLMVALVLVMATILLVIKVFVKPAAPSTTPQLVKIENPVSETTVAITAKGFSPETVKVKKGTSVAWLNQDSKPHQIKSDPHPSDKLYSFLNTEDPLDPDGVVSLNFEQAGTFTYHDEMNPLKFKGTIIVE